MNLIKDAVRRVLESQGRQITPYPNSDLMRRMKLFNHFTINKILDVGANDGCYAMHMMKLGFKGAIISFEPIKHIFENLLLLARKHPNWHGENIALGDSDAEAVINIAGNGGKSSSILDMLPTHFNASPESKYVGTEKIVVKKLDSVFSKYYEKGDNILLKIDTQGFERHVLAGAEQSLPHICGVQIELSLQELYKGQMLYRDMIAYLEQRGFTLFSFENGFYDRKTGKLLQLDGIFFQNF